jgi:hypothetical protein
VARANRTVAMARGGIAPVYRARLARVRGDGFA